MSAYDIINERPSELDIMLVTTRKIVEKFPKEIFAFSFVGDHFRKMEELSLSQNFVSLSVMLSLSKEEIISSLAVPKEEAHAVMVETMPNFFSWDVFLDGEPYNYYSKKPTFWESIADILLDSGTEFNFRQQRRHIELAKVLIHSGKINRFPRLMEQIKDTDMSFFGY